VVTDWPINAGLSGGEEYKEFFEWAEHLNNYHPATADESLRYLLYSHFATKLKFMTSR
jgi:hypothetical protein